MKLKTEVLLASALTIVVCFGVSEVLGYHQAAEFFTEHEMRIQQGGENEALLAVLRQGKRSLLWELAALRVLSAVVAVAALSVVLNLLWRRLVSRPINLLLDQMGSMSRGTWTQPIPVERQDEIGRLVREFNLLGPRLTFVAHQYAAASKLAAMALIGQRVVRRTSIARGRVLEILEIPTAARGQNQVVPETAVHRAQMVADELYSVAADFEADFHGELARKGLPAPLRCDASRQASKAGHIRDELSAN